MLAIAALLAVHAGLAGKFHVIGFYNVKRSDKY